MPGIPPLLAELLQAPAAPGHEDAVQAIVRREVAALGAEISTDVLGSTTARLRGAAGGQTLGLFAHADQVAMIVRAVEANGLLTVTNLGGWRAAAACGQRVRVMTKAGEVRGVVVGPTEGEPTWDSLRVDIGADGKEGALELAGPGDWIVLHAPPEELPGGRVLSGALDDRLGIFVALQVLERLAASPPEWDVALVVTGQEETGTHGGARLAAQQLSPDAAIVVEVTYDGDVPGPSPWGDVRLGGGPTIFRGAVVSPLVGDGLLAVAAAEGIDVAIESGQSTWSDADDIFTAGDGVATAIVCVPLRYMHTAGEIAQLSDADAAARLIEGYARSLRSGVSLRR
jgi:putative aminopeptidase FrvX